jgi:hypothetical protein
MAAISRPTIIYTLGDSNLDNLFWHINKEKPNIKEAQQSSVEGQLREILQCEIISQDYAGFTTKSVLEGDIIGKHLPLNMPAKDLYMTAKKTGSYFTDPSGHITARPLEELKKSITSKTEARHIVVISAGGDEFREGLTKSISWSQFIPEIQKRYIKIVEEVEAMGADPVLILQYRPESSDQVYSNLEKIGYLFAVIHSLLIATTLIAAWALLQQKIGMVARGALMLISAVFLYFSTRIIPLKVTRGVISGQRPGMTMMGILMERLYRPILEMANKKKLAVLDLTNIFNPNDSSLYVEGIVPSAIGGKLIVVQLSRLLILWSSRRSVIVTGQRGRELSTGNSFPNKWTVEYPSKV